MLQSTGQDSWRNLFSDAESEWLFPNLVVLKFAQISESSGGYYGTNCYGTNGCTPSLPP